MITKLNVDDPPFDSPCDGPASEPSGSPLQGATEAEVADYIADMLQELRDLSTASGQGPLGMLLELAQREARRNAQRAIGVNSIDRPRLAG